MNNKKLFIAGVGALFLLIVANSMKPIKLVEVQEGGQNTNFDAQSLPDTLRPPVRMNDGEEMPKRYLPMKNFSNLTLKPRFDR